MFELCAVKNPNYSVSSNECQKEGSIKLLCNRPAVPFMCLGAWVEMNGGWACMSGGKRGWGGSEKNRGIETDVHF